MSALVNDGANAHIGTAMGLYVLGALNPSESEAVERHLLVCEECQVACDDLMAVTAQMSVLTEEDVAEVMRAAAERSLLGGRDAEAS